MSLFLSQLPPEKRAAIERGENVQITEEEVSRFRVAMALARPEPKPQPE